MNKSEETRTFTASSTTLWAGQAHAIFYFQPASLTLTPGQSGMVTGSMAIPHDFAAGCYEAEISITGAYQQIAIVKLQVGCEGCNAATCEIIEVQRRERIRAHQWYHHFQCVEPCDEDRSDWRAETGA